MRVEAAALLARYLDQTRLAERAAMVMRLRPEQPDYARVFTAEVVENARAAYEAIWKTAPVWRVRPEQNFLRVTAASVHDLRERTGQASTFPGGYLEALPFLRLDVVWVCWEFLAPGSTGGMMFDGLVPLGGRWAWFPKPWKALSVKPKATTSHWSD